MVVPAMGPILVYANVAKKPCSDTDHLCRLLTLGTRVTQSCGGIRVAIRLLGTGGRECTLEVLRFSGPPILGARLRVGSRHCVGLRDGRNTAKTVLFSLGNAALPSRSS
jgi:hypothetical protein